MFSKDQVCSNENKPVTYSSGIVCRWLKVSFRTRSLGQQITKLQMSSAKSLWDKSSHRNGSWNPVMLGNDRSRFHDTFNHSNLENPPMLRSSHTSPIRLSKFRNSSSTRALLLPWRFQEEIIREIWRNFIVLEIDMSNEESGTA